MKCGTHHGCIAFIPDISSEQNLKFPDDKDQGEMENNKHEKIPSLPRQNMINNTPMATSGPQSVARGLTWNF